MNMKQLLAFLLFVVIAISLIYNVNDANTTMNEKFFKQTIDARLSSVGQQVNPQDKLISIDGSTIPLSHFKGAPLVVMFWATWCDACKIQLPDIIAAQNRYPNSQFIYLPIHSKEADVAMVNQEYGNAMAIYLKQWQSGESILSGNTLPLTFVINAQGEIVHEQLGYSSKEGMNYLNKYLQQPLLASCSTMNSCQMSYF
jgi:thiol-disulfide isomerase/thioredoxin